MHYAVDSSASLGDSWKVEDSGVQVMAIMMTQ
jgi:hypothetical protein